MRKKDKIMHAIILVREHNAGRVSGMCETERARERNIFTSDSMLLMRKGKNL